MKHLRRSIVALGLTGVLGMGLVPSAQAQQAGLVNVNIEDVNVILQDLVDANLVIQNVAVPIGIAANVCDVNAAVLAAAAITSNDANCRATNNQKVTQKGFVHFVNEENNKAIAA
jgi:hypothetical protein